MEEGGKVEHTSLKDLREAYKEVIQKYFPAELRNRKNIRVISVGCGMAAEAQAFTNLGQQPKVYYEGIDNSPYIVGAQSLNSDIPAERFRLTDARDKESFGDQPWDLVILRNPQIRIQTGGVSDEWKKIFINCVNSLENNGFIFLTTTSEYEMDATVSFLQGLGVKVTEKPQLLGVDLGKFPLREQEICVLQKKPDQLQSS